jgi:hypothetical protein
VIPASVKTGLEGVGSWCDSVGLGLSSGLKSSAGDGGGWFSGEGAGGVNDDDSCTCSHIDGVGEMSVGGGDGGCPLGEGGGGGGSSDDDSELEVCWLVVGSVCVGCSCCVGGGDGEGSGDESCVEGSKVGDDRGVSDGRVV